MADPSGNGVVLDQAQRDRLFERLIGEPLTAGYRPSVPLTYLTSSDWAPQIYLLRDIELMIVHPIVRTALEYFKSGVAGAEFWGGPSPTGDPNGLPISEDPDVANFVQEQCSRFWDRGVPLLQNGYAYGWIGCENSYAEENNVLSWKCLKDFSPRDAYLLTQDKRWVGVRVKNVLSRGEETPKKGGGQTDLWTGSLDVPAKGLWYAHHPRFSSFYGQSQLLGAWRPWRRLAWKDAAETIIDTGVYRYAFAGPYVEYPEEDLQVATGAQPGNPPGTTLDAQGFPRRWSRDLARQLAEWIKAGAGVGIPSTKYPPEMGGGPKWKVELPDHVIDVDPLINYAKYLQDQIAYGVGVSPELLAAAETGSGYSGRGIVLDAFLYQQQRIADSLLHLFIDQVLIPLVRWNFGTSVQWRCEVKNLLESKNKARQVQQQQEKGKGPPEAKPDFPLAPEAEGKSTPGWPRTPEQTADNAAQAFSLHGGDHIAQIAARILRGRAA